MLYSTLLPLLLVSASWHVWPSLAEKRKRPNIVFILTDDQDAKLNSLDYMPHVQELLVQEGTHFKSHYCTVAWCCPSRVSLWTGKAAHNTNVTNVERPYGGYPKFVEEGHNDNWVPVWLQSEGYQTYYAGKLMNAQNIVNYAKPYAKGFTGSDFLLDPNTYNYMNPIFQRNKLPPIPHKSEYSTDLVRKKALGFLDDAIEKPDSPFFVAVAPIAPHSDYTVGLDIGGDPPIGVNITPPVASEKYRDLFQNASVPRGSNFNPDVPSGVDWIAELLQLSAENITYNDHLYRQRLRALQSVDEIVKDVVDKLDQAGILDNTYIFYSSDNGYHIGQHRLAPGKGCGFEEDINVPLVVRGPGVPAGKVITRSTTHTDLAPTWWQILGIPLREEFDGIAIPLTESGIAELEESKRAKEHIQIEFWSKSNPQEYNKETEVNSTYKAIRIVGEDYGFYYAVWCSNSHELYDMKADPSQMNNLYSASGSSKIPCSNATTTLGRPLPALTARLDALILALKTCKGAKACTEPWDTLLPGADVYTLAEAMDEKYDDFFAGLPKIEFDRCEEGHITDAEGPVWTEDLEWSEGGDIKRSLSEGVWDANMLARRGRHALNRP
ncbi:arylsulfatase [Paraphaeosphaeria sporulosa]